MMSNLTDEKIKFLEDKAREIRISIIEMLVAAGSGHSAGPLGMADVFTPAIINTSKNSQTKRPGITVGLFLIAVDATGFEPVTPTLSR